MGTACDKLGNVYLCGYTGSTGMATTGSHQSVTGGGQDAFLVKFDTAGVRQWATYYGGTATEQGFAVTCDRTNNVYMTGYTNNSTTGIATTGAHQTAGGGGQDAFLVKFNSAGVRQWSTYYGGSATDQGFALACDSNKNVFLAGYTNNSLTGIATAAGHQTAGGGGQDGFIAKFDSTGVRQWGTYYGGTGTERCLGIAVDPAGSCYATGNTLSLSGISTTGSHQSSFGGGTCCADMFLVKLNSAGVRQWGTYYGHTGDESGNAVCTDALGHVYVTGYGSSDSNIVTPGAIKDTFDVMDAFVVKFDTAGVRIWGTYFGGEDIDQGNGIYCNSLSKLFVGGVTASVTGIATTGAHQTTKGGSINDGFLAVINDCNLSAPALITGADTVCKGGTYTYSVPAMPGAGSYTWAIPVGWTGSSSTNSITLTAGTMNDTIHVTVNYLCGSSSQVVKAVKISPAPIISPSGTIAFCNGDSATLTVGTGITYQWLNSMSPIAGATTQNYIAHSPGHYSAVVTNSLGCTDTSSTDTVTVHPLPLPVITSTGSLLSTGIFSSYQWKHNGTSITGATSNSYTVIVTTGLYTVTVTDTNGCEGTSLPFDASTLGIDETAGRLPVVHIYPNPVTDLLYISSATVVDATISSVEGRLIGHYPAVRSIDMKNYTAGMYLLRITDHTGRLISTDKIVKHTNR